MGRKFRLGKIPKNYERKQQAGNKRSRGRPKHHKTPPMVPRPASDTQQQDESLSAIHAAIVANSQWVDLSRLPETIILSKLSTSGTSPSVTLSVIVQSDRSWRIIVHNRKVSTTCSLLSHIPSRITTDSLKSLMTLLNSCSICPGHPDKHFIDLLESKRGKLLSKNGSEMATIDPHDVSLNGETHSKTVRHSKCELLVGSGKCSSCVAYRNTLRKINHRWLKQKALSPSRRESVTSKVNFTHLNTPEKQRRYTNLRTQLKTTEKQMERLKDKIDHMMKLNGVDLGPETHEDFKSIMTDMTEDVRQKHPPESFERVFWEQQLVALNKKDRRQIRWHPAIIKWCLHLKFLSSGAYHAMRSSGLFLLPSERTLRDYTHFVKGRPGFSPEVNDLLVKEANINADKDRYVVLIWDEMKIKDDLVFDKHTCELIGFVNCGDVNNHLDDLERKCNSSEDEIRDVASHMLLFMVRGIFSNLEFPYAQFPTGGASADVLYPMVWEAVSNLESSGFKVVAFSCDGASANRKFYKMHGTGYKTINPYSDDRNREIFFFSDVPHLIKTTRNCFSNSFAHANTRGMWVSSSVYIHFPSVKSACTTYRRMGSILVGRTWRDYIIETRGENQD